MRKPFGDSSSPCRRNNSSFLYLPFGRAIESWFQYSKFSTELDQISNDFPVSAVAPTISFWLVPKDLYVMLRHEFFFRLKALEISFPSPVISNPFENRMEFKALYSQKDCLSNKQDKPVFDSTLWWKLHWHWDVEIESIAISEKTPFAEATIRIFESCNWVKIYFTYQNIYFPWSQ